MNRILLSTMLALGLLLSVGSLSADKKQGNRFFEMRTYTTHPGKLDDLHKRFSDHTNRIFQKHGMELVAYWTPTEEGKDDTLVYVLAYKSKAARDKAWAGFKKDPDWQKAFKASRKDGPIVKKVVNRFLTPTDYSPIK